MSNKHYRFIKHCLQSQELSSQLFIKGLTAGKESPKIQLLGSTDRDLATPIRIVWTVPHG